MSRAARGRRASFEADEDMILGFAPELRPTEFVTAMQHWCQVVDDERRKRDPNAKFDQRFLELNRTFDGHSNLDGFLDQEAAALLERALAKIMGPPDPRNGPLPPRTARQRRADALIDMARESLANATPGGHVPAHVDAVYDLNTIVEHAEPDAAQRRREIFGRGHTIDGRPAARATLERLCCDAAIARVVHGRRVRSPRPRSPSPVPHRGAVPGADAAGPALPVPGL